MRKLASIRRIKELYSIPKADNIEMAVVDGWECVVKKGDFKAGDYCIYFEIDSILPDHDVFDFMRTRRLRVKTARFMKQISQGLVMPISIAREITGKHWAAAETEGTDFTEWLGVKKWEPYKKQPKFNRKKTKRHPAIEYMLQYPLIRKIYYNLGGKKPTNFPWFIKKTDEERVQNLTNIFKLWHWKECYMMEKLDGMSGTYAVHSEAKTLHWLMKYFTTNFYVCSRNLTYYKENNSEWWEIARQFDIKNKLEEAGGSISIQGEIVGQMPGYRGVQGNKYKLIGLDFYIFNVVDLKENRYFNIDEKIEFCDKFGFKHMPVKKEFIMHEDTTVKEMVEIARQKSTIADIHQEGIVIRQVENDRLSFKAINPDFLLKYDE